jgi:hypothetical protein
MAIVADLSGNVREIDVSFSSFKRISAGEPNEILLPTHAGEIVLDTANNTLWKAMGQANNTWVALTPW